MNELSLTGQFKDEDDFFNHFDSILEIIKLIELLKFSIAKEYMFFDVAITYKYKLGDFLRLRTDRAKRMKRFLAKLAQNPPYWNDIQKHDCSDNSYIFKERDVCSTSLAESCERDKVILSFRHEEFLDTQIKVEKNSDKIELYNLICKDGFLDFLLKSSIIEAKTYCQEKFKNSNLDFSLLKNKDGFGLLETTQQVDEFIDAFIEFSTMSWENIISSDGLQYKKYNGKEFKNQNIYKFRITQKYRCFGYREDNIFFVLKFEIDHKMSDNG